MNAALESLQLQDGYLANTGGHVMCWRVDLDDEDDGRHILISDEGDDFAVGVYKNWGDEGVVFYGCTADKVRAFVAIAVASVKLAKEITR